MLAIRSGQQEWTVETTYNGVVGDVVGLAPAGHDELVVVGNEDDLVNALGLNLLVLLDVRGQVVGGAGGGEGTGDGDDDNLLVLGVCTALLA